MPPERSSQVFTALADPTRRALLDRLAYGPATAGQLADLCAMSRPGVSQHLRVLRGASVVRTTRQGKFIWYELDAALLMEAEAWLRDLTGHGVTAPTLRNTFQSTSIGEPA